MLNNNKENIVIDEIKAAAIFDVTGSFYITSYKQKKTNREIVYPRIILTSSRLCKNIVLFWLKEKFGGSVSKRNDGIYWTINSKLAITFLKKIEPFLINSDKKNKAKWIIKNWPDSKSQENLRKKRKEQFQTKFKNKKRKHEN